MHAFVSGRLDSCNSLLAGVTSQLLQKLQVIQNAATHLVTGAFSPAKTVCIHFCKLRKPHSEPTQLLNGTPKFLGVIFDRKLSFIPHIKHLKDKCTKALNLLRVVVHTSWGADQETLLHLYRSLIRSKLDYGCIVYGSACSS